MHLGGAIDYSGLTKTVSGTDYFQVTLDLKWSNVPQGMRPMLMIKNPQNSHLIGFAAMRVEQ